MNFHGNHLNSVFVQENYQLCGLDAQKDCGMKPDDFFDVSLCN